MTAAPGRYYTFLQWSDGNTNSPRTITITTSNNLYTAIFTNTVPLEDRVLPQWELTWGGTADERASAVAATADGGYLVGVQTVFSDVDHTSPFPTNYGVADYEIIRLDSAGHTIWTKVFGTYENDSLVRIVSTPDGGFLLVGVAPCIIDGTKTNSVVGVTNVNKQQVWLVRIDSTGTELWQRSYRWEVGVSAGTGANDIQPTADGGFVLVGGINGTYGQTNAPPYGLEAYVLRMDSQGNKLWDRSYGGYGLDSAAGVRIAADGGFFVLGDSTSLPSGNKTSTHSVSANM